MRFENLNILESQEYLGSSWLVVLTKQGDRSFADENLFKTYKPEIGVNTYHLIGNDVFSCEERGMKLVHGDESPINYFDGFYVTSVIKDKEGFVWVTTIDNGVFVAAYLSQARINAPIEENEKITALGVLEGKVCLGTNLGNFYALDKHYSLYQKVPFDTKEIRQLKNFYNYKSNLQYTLMSYRQVNGEYIYENNQVYQNYRKSLNRRLGSVFVLPSDQIIEEYPQVVKLVHGGLVDKNYNSFYDFCIQEHNLYFTFENTIAKLGKNDSMYRLIELDVLDKDAMVTSLDYCKEYLIAGTRGDGVLILKDDKMVAHFTQDGGLISNLINGCHVQKQKGRIWCATNEGVSVLQLNGKNSEQLFSLEGNLNRSDGLFSNYVLDIKENNGQIVCASTRGLTFFDSDYTIRINKPPAVSIVSYTQGDSNYEKGGIVFAYNQNNFEFHYNAVTNKPVKNRFRYRLVTDDVQGAWSHTDERSLRIENLPPGSHVFEVCARAQNTEWSDPVGYTFDISKRFIDRWWVRLLFLMVLVTLVYVIYKRRVRSIIDRNNLELAMQELELKNSKLESKALRGQMNPHFVFNVLNSIQKLILTEDKASANKLLNRFSKLIRSSLKYSRLEFIPIDQEVEFLTNYLNIETLRYPERFTFEISVKDLLVEEEIKLPPLVIQPLCENAIKHAFKENGGRLYVTISKLDEYSLRIVVSDNGIGIENAKKIQDSESLGLEIVRNRLDLFKDQGYKAEMKVSSLNSALQTGTVIELRLPYK